MKKKSSNLIIAIITCLVIIFGANKIYSGSDNHDTKKAEQALAIHDSNEVINKENSGDSIAVDNEKIHHESEVIHQSEEHGEEHAEGEHGSDMSPLFFVILALIIGAATRQLLKGFFLPYTVSLLIIGIILGILTRVGVFEGALESIGKAIQWAGNINPHLILFIFLPTLIFEAAFAMDVHTFKKTSTNAFLLAVPGILVALFLTAGLIIGFKKLGLGFYNWKLEIALMFGAVISATDPVAVVALLKELGASKKLGTLIEGESLLNDGTAIVIFMVFFTALTGVATGSGPVIQFLWVSVGGIGLGIIIGGLTISWVRKVFNDALVEISIMIAAAYVTFFIAEHFIHVSGVLALVAFGLAMAGRGKTRISPEVEHFLHEFWELAAFIANTLIFIIVGMVIAQRTKFTPNDFILLGILYIAIHIIRAFMIVILYPFMRKAGYGLPKKDAYVLWYGALRGAVGLALALVVAGVDEKYIPAQIRNQFLFLTAGIVTLTLLVNATTIKFLINKLGLTKIAPAKLLMIANADQFIKHSLKTAEERYKNDRFMGHADWKEVEHYLERETTVEVPKDIKIDTIAETRRRVLEKEKSSYWGQFKEGLIGPTAVRTLTENIKEIIDKGGSLSLSDRVDLEDLWKSPKLFDRLQGIPVLGRLVEGFFFERLSVSYDCARGFIDAQEEALKLVNSMSFSQQKQMNEEEIEKLKQIESEIEENKIHGLTFLRILRKNYPEIYDAISTRQAIRTMLNHELGAVERLLNNGRLDSSEAEKLIEEIEEKMKRLMEKPPKVKLPDIDEILWEVPWLHNLEPGVFNHAIQYFQKRVFAVGDNLTKSGTTADSIFIIVRGTVKVMLGNEAKALLGPGSTIGELAVMTGKHREASVSAISPVTALRIKYVKFIRLIQEAPQIKQKIWEIAGKRYAENVLSGMEPYKTWNKKQLTSWVQKGTVENPVNKDIEFIDQIGVLLFGVAFESERKKLKEIDAPNILSGHKYGFMSNSWVYISPKLKK